MSTPSSPRLTGERLRGVMRHWATGVAVVASSRYDEELDCVVHSGCTVNAVTSVSLDPPLVLVCLADTARTFATVRRSQQFTLSFLTEAQAEAALVFASDAPEQEKFERVPTFLLEEGPVVEGSLAHLACRVTATHRAGTHNLLIGEVCRGEHRSSGEPLLFYGGAFWERSGTA
jgi:flavin reductase (DIM6/NTAB) family NADH-FMN oxidoreductase RutF